MARKRLSKLQKAYMEVEGIDDARELLNVGKWQMLETIAMQEGVERAAELLKSSSGGTSDGGWKEVRAVGNSWDLYSNRDSIARRIKGTKPHFIPANPILSNWYNPYRSGASGTYGHPLFFSKIGVFHPGTAPDRSLSEAWNRAPKVATDTIGLIFYANSSRYRLASGRFGKMVEA